MPRHAPETVTATEIADFVFCPEAWRLAQLGHRAANQPARDAGTAHHAGMTTAEGTAGRAIAIGRVLIVLALAALAVLWALGR